MNQNSGRRQLTNGTPKGARPAGTGKRGSVLDPSGIGIGGKARQIQQEREPRRPFYQSADRRTASTEDDIPLTVAGHRPIDNPSRALANHDFENTCRVGRSPPPAELPQYYPFLRATALDHLPHRAEHRCRSLPGSASEEPDRHLSGSERFPGAALFARTALSSVAASTSQTQITRSGRLPSRGPRSQAQVLGNQTRSAALPTNRSPENPAATSRTNSLLPLVRSTSEVLAGPPLRAAWRPSSRPVHPACRLFVVAATTP
jgi:hypothetical protein